MIKIDYLISLMFYKKYLNFNNYPFIINFYIIKNSYVRKLRLKIRKIKICYEKNQFII